MSNDGFSSDEEEDGIFTVTKRAGPGCCWYCWSCLLNERICALVFNITIMVLFFTVLGISSANADFSITLSSGQQVFAQILFPPFDSVVDSQNNCSVNEDNEDALGTFSETETSTSQGPLLGILILCSFGGILMLVPLIFSAFDLNGKLMYKRLHPKWIRFIFCYLLLISTIALILMTILVLGVNYYIGPAQCFTTFLAVLSSNLLSEGFSIQQVATITSQLQSQANEISSLAWISMAIFGLSVLNMIFYCSFFFSERSWLDTKSWSRVDVGEYT